MYLVADAAVVDRTTANANVFYEPWRPSRFMPFDVVPLRGLPYRLNARGMPEHPDQDRQTMAERPKGWRNPVEDSPLFNR